MSVGWAAVGQIAADDRLADVKHAADDDISKATERIKDAEAVLLATQRELNQARHNLLVKVIIGLQTWGVTSNVLATIQARHSEASMSESLEQTSAKLAEATEHCLQTEREAEARKRSIVDLQANHISQ